MTLSQESSKQISKRNRQLEDKTKPKLEPISKSRILKNELEEFEWYFVDIKQLQQRIEWLKVKIADPLVEIDVQEKHHLNLLIEEAFKEVSSHSSTH